MRYRSSSDIIAKILDAALSGETKTKIMMTAHLNYIQTTRYIPYILSERLLEKRSESIYATTEKGRAFLQKYEKVKIEKYPI